jgi:hypothetical protein
VPSDDHGGVGSERGPGGRGVCEASDVRGSRGIEGTPVERGRIAREVRAPPGADAADEERGGEMRG